MSYLDGVCFFTLDSVSKSKRRIVKLAGGRTDRGYSTDQEVMIHVPHDLLMPLAGSSWPADSPFPVGVPK